MGWSGGSDVMSMIARVLKKHLTEDQRREIYPPIIRVLENQDWDTQDEATGIDPILDSILGKPEEDDL